MRFLPGKIMITPGAADALIKDDVKPGQFLQQHLEGDWGEMPEEDKAQNDRHLEAGQGMIMSCYRTPDTRERIWIITEHDRSVTTILLPEEY